ncbi:hypothetical protein AVEN_232113-1 [Araneus ventricosus]|uniref:Uncharacterized protein n=1 Tax=Araneus ventricosus TaxID=182803 RepID=A0A4Y2FT37_ARAVE|nr:hypothetical protein AVEN_232113-1 [Araneus ventricosus]
MQNKFQEGDTQVWAINCQERKEPLFSRKIHSGARNLPSPASVEWDGLRRDRAHRVKRGIANAALVGKDLVNCRFNENDLSFSQVNLTVKARLLGMKVLN